MIEWTTTVHSFSLSLSPILAYSRTTQTCGRSTIGAIPFTVCISLPGTQPDKRSVEYLPLISTELTRFHWLRTHTIFFKTRTIYTKLSHSIVCWCFSHNHSIVNVQQGCSIWFWSWLIYQLIICSNGIINSLFVPMEEVTGRLGRWPTSECLCSPEDFFPKPLLCFIPYKKRNW